MSGSFGVSKVSFEKLMLNLLFLETTSEPGLRIVFAYGFPSLPKTTPFGRCFGVVALPSASLTTAELLLPSCSFLPLVPLALAFMPKEKIVFVA